jgi:hypothetical protein
MNARAERFGRRVRYAFNPFSKDGVVSETIYKRMSDGLVSLSDLSEPVPQMEKFFDTSYVAQPGAVQISPGAKLDLGEEGRRRTARTARTKCVSL